MPFDSAQYEVTQVFYTSKDGTRVPMFIAGKKGLARGRQGAAADDGLRRLQSPMTPEWNPKYAWWMEQGGFFAVPNLRGGGEYGEPWHKAAMFENKQNVFDDWFAAARISDRQPLHDAGALGAFGTVERRSADGRVDDAAAGSVWGDLVRLSAAGYAAVPEVRVRAAVDDGVWLGGKREGFRVHR